MARASALHAEGQGFDSLILHQNEVLSVAKEKENKKIKGKKSTRIKITTQTFIQFIGK